METLTMPIVVEDHPCCTPVRRVLDEGSEVTVLYLAATEDGVVVRVEDEGRVVLVVTEHGETLRFLLMASAHYVTQDRSARLRF